MLDLWHPGLTSLPLESLLVADIAGYERELTKAIAREDAASFIEFLLAIIFKALPVWEPQLSQGLQPEIQVQARVELSANTQVKRRTKTQEKILQLLGADPRLTLKQVAEQLEVAISTVERAAADLKKANKLRFNGPRKKGYWEVLPD